MATENIDIVVHDKIDNNITIKLIAIADNSEKASSSLSKLQSALSSLNASALVQLQSALARTVSEVDQLAAALGRVQAAWAKVGAGAGTGFSQQVRAVRETEQAVNGLAGAYGALQASLGRVQGALAANTAAQLAAVQAMHKLQAAFTTVGIQLIAHKQRLDSVANATTSTINITAHLNSVFLYMLGLRLAEYLKNLVDEFTSLHNRLGTITESAGEAARVMQTLFDIANATRAPVATLTTLFQQVGLATRELGTSAKDTERFVQAIAQAIAIQGGSAISARGALIQLSQALGTGLVRAEEFNSMLEGAFTVVKYAAQGIDRVGGSVGRLRQEVISGKVTSAEFFNAILSQSQAIDAQFKKTSTTIDQAFTVLNNKLLEFVGTSHIASDVTGVLTTLIIGLANSVDFLGRSFIAAIIAFGSFKAISTVVDVMSALNAVAAQNAATNVGLGLQARVASNALAGLSVTLAQQRTQFRENTAAYRSAEAALNVLLETGITRGRTYNRLVKEMNAADTARQAIMTEAIFTRSLMQQERAAIATATASMQAATAMGVLRNALSNIAMYAVNLIRSNPFTAWIAAAATALGVLYAFSDKLMLSDKYAVSLHDALLLVLRVVGDLFSAFGTGLSLAVEGWLRLTGAILDTPFQLLRDIANFLGFKDVDISFYGFIRAFTYVVDTVIDLAITMVKVVQNQFSLMGKSSAQIIREEMSKSHLGDYLFKDIDEKLEAEKSKIKDFAGSIKDFLKDTAIQPDKPVKFLDENALLKVVKITQEYKREIAEETTLLGLVGNARIAQQVIFKEEAKLRRDGLDISKREREELRAKLIQLEQRKQVSQGVDKLYADSSAQKANNYLIGLKAINEALIRNLITGSEAGVAARKLAYEYAQLSLSPVDKVLKDVNDQLVKQTALFGAVGVEAAKVAAVFDADRKATEQGGLLTPADVVIIENTTEQLYNMSKAQGYLNEAFAQAEDPLTRYYAKIDAANELYQKGKISLDGLRRAEAAFEKELGSNSVEKQAAAIEHVVMKLKDELRALELLNDEREKAVKLNQIMESLDSKRITPTSQEKDKIVSLINQIAYTKQLSQAVDELYNASKAKQAKDHSVTLDAINEALRRGIINADEAALATQKLQYAFSQLSLTPAAKVMADLNTQLERQIALFGEVGAGAARAAAVYEAQQKAKLEVPGGVLSPEATRTIEALATQTYNLGKQQEYMNDVYAKSVSPLDTYLKKMEAANYLYNHGKLTLDELHRAQASITKELNSAEATTKVRVNGIDMVVMKLQDEIRATKMLADVREREAKWNQIKESLAGKGITPTAEQEAEIKSLIATVVEQGKVQQQLDSIYSSSEGVIKTYERTLAAINILYAQSPQYIQQYVKAMDEAKMKVLEINNTVVAGLEHGILAQLKKVSDVTGIVSNWMSHAFTETENAWVNFLKTGKMEWASFAQSIIEQTMHMVTQLLILKPILEAIRAAINGSTSGAGGWVSTLLGVVGGGVSAGAGGGAGGGMMAFATGGEFTVGGSAATDSNVVAFRATRGERVRVDPPGGSSGGGQVNVNIQNYGTGKAFDVEQVDAQTVRIIARDEASNAVRRDAPQIIAAQIRDPNSRVSSALNASTQTVRRR